VYFVFSSGTVNKYDDDDDDDDDISCRPDHSSKLVASYIWDRQTDGRTDTQTCHEGSADSTDKRQCSTAGKVTEVIQFRSCHTYTHLADRALYLDH